MHKQNDGSRENSNTKYFWVITEPVLPNCRQVLWFVCLTISKRSDLPHEGCPTTLYLLYLSFVYCIAFRDCFYVALPF